MSTENINTNNLIETGWLSDYKGKTAFVPNTLSSSVLLTEDGSIKLNEIVNTKENSLTENGITKTVKEIHIGSLSENQAVSECSSTATGINSHAEGNGGKASGEASHAEGQSTWANGNFSHAEGNSTQANGEASHAEGQSTWANGNFSHAEGNSTQANGEASHAEGEGTFASGYSAHAEGNSTHATGINSHAEGSSTFAEGQSSHAEGHYTHAKEKYSHAEGNDTWANKEASHAEGKETSADGICSHAEGYYTRARGDYSHAEGHGENSINFGANGKYSHIEGYCTAANGEASHAEGYDTRADGKASHAEGYSSVYWPGDSAVSGEMSEEMLALWNGIGFTLASGDYSHAEGRDTLALGDYSHAEGYKTRASGEFSHAQGYDTKALGRYSFSGGLSTVANGQNDMAFGQGSITSYDDVEDEPYKYPYFSYAFGNNLISKGFQFAIGSYNTKPHYSLPFYGLGPAFVIGSGTSDDSRSNAFRVNYSGSVYSGHSGQFNTSGADYAEYFEWIDKNQEFQDRRGYFVTLEEEKIKIANSNDYILGVISSSPGIIGNSDEEWLGRHILDDFGSPIFEEYEYKDPITEENKIGKRYKQNPDYDPSLQYIQRADRPEWDAVGMLGVLSVRDDGTCQVNGYCTVTDGGIATASETGYRVIKRVNDYIIKIIFK